MGGIFGAEDPGYINLPGNISFQNTEDGPVQFNTNETDDVIDDDDDDSPPPEEVDPSLDPETGFTEDEDGNIVCNKAGYIYNETLGMCEPPPEEEEEDSGGGGIFRDDDSGSSTTSVVEAAPTYTSRFGPSTSKEYRATFGGSRPVTEMQQGGMAGISNVADNFLRAVQGAA